MNIKVTKKTSIDNKILKRFLSELPEATMRVGWNKNQREYNGMKTWEVAYLNENGYTVTHPNGKQTEILPRPFLGYTSETKKEYWKNAWRLLLRGYISNEIKTFRNVMVRFCRKYVIESIRKVVIEERPFAPNYRTNKKTGKKEILNKTPLIDFGTMIKTLTFETKIKE